jgi:hypothetical protein
MRSIALAIICIVVLAACKKSNDSVTADFSPLTVGSNWTYLINGVTNKLTVTNKDTVAQGRTYKVLSNNNGGNQYQAKSGNEYYRLAVIQGVLPNGFDELYLKSDQNVNGNWQLNVPIVITGIPVNVTSKYNIVEKGITKTVQGKTYSDVIHVRQDFISSFGNSGGGDNYYAKGIGLISSSLTISIPGQSSSTTAELVSYEIK